MKRCIIIILISCSLAAMTGTVSHAGEPRDPIPKIEKPCIEKSLFVSFICQDINISSPQACADVGDHPAYFKNISNAQMDADVFEPGIYRYRPDRPERAYQHYRLRSILTGQNKINSPPDITVRL